MKKSKKWFPIFLIIVVLTLFAFFILNQYIYDQKQNSNEITQYSATLMGEYVCLPLVDRDVSPSQTCSFGIKTESGEYYALDLSQTNAPPDLQIGDAFTITGQITPLELLSTDHWRKYPIQGIFTVQAIIFHK